MTESDIGYLAGLFDGEGSAQCKQKWTKKKKHKGEGYRDTYAWNISMEIAMTDEQVIRWVHEVLQVGSVIKRNVKGLNKAGKKYKTQWRWRCTYRDAYQVCRLIWPEVKVKLHKVEQIIDHYEPDLGDNIVDLELERQVRRTIQ